MFLLSSPRSLNRVLVDIAIANHGKTNRIGGCGYIYKYDAYQSVLEYSVLLLTFGRKIHGFVCFLFFPLVCYLEKWLDR